MAYRLAERYTAQADCDHEDRLSTISMTLMPLRKFVGGKMSNSAKNEREGDQMTSRVGRPGKRAKKVVWPTACRGVVQSDRGTIPVTPKEGRVKADLYTGGAEVIDSSAMDLRRPGRRRGVSKR